MLSSTFQGGRTTARGVSTAPRGDDPDLRPAQATVMTAVAQTNTQARNNVRPHKKDDDWDPDLNVPMTRKDANSNVVPVRAGQVLGRPATFSARGGRGGTPAGVPSANTAATRPISKPTTDDSDWAACPRPIVPARNGTAALPMPYTAHRVVSVATAQINNGMETRSLRDLTYAAARARAEVATAVRSPANSSDAAPQLGTAAAARDDNSTCVPAIRGGLVRPGAEPTATRAEPATAGRSSANTSALAPQLDTERRYGTAATARDNNSTSVLPIRSALVCPSGDAKPTATRAEPATARRSSANTSDLASQLDTERRYGTAATARDNKSTFVLPTRAGIVRPGAEAATTRAEPATAVRPPANSSDAAPQLNTEYRFGTAATAQDNNSTFALPIRSAFVRPSGGAEPTASRAGPARAAQPTANVSNKAAQPVAAENNSFDPPTKTTVFQGSGGRGRGTFGNRSAAREASPWTRPPFNDMDDNTFLRLCALDDNRDRPFTPARGRSSLRGGRGGSLFGAPAAKTFGNDDKSGIGIGDDRRGSSGGRGHRSARMSLRGGRAESGVNVDDSFSIDNNFGTNSGRPAHARSIKSAPFVSKARRSTGQLLGFNKWKGSSRRRPEAAAEEAGSKFSKMSHSFDDRQGEIDLLNAQVEELTSASAQSTPPTSALVEELKKLLQDALDDGERKDERIKELSIQPTCLSCWDKRGQETFMIKDANGPSGLGVCGDLYCSVCMDMMMRDLKQCPHCRREVVKRVAIRTDQNGDGDGI